MRKLALVLTLIAAIFCTSAYAYAPADTKITVNCVNQNAEKVLNEVGKQAGMNFVYKSETAKKWPKITYKATQVPAEDAISQIAAKLGVPYRINKNIVTFGQEKSGRVNLTLRGTVVAMCKYYDWYYFNSNGEIANPFQLIDLYTTMYQNFFEYDPVNYGYYNLAKGNWTKDQLNSYVDTFRNNNWAKAYGETMTPPSGTSAV